MKLFKCWMFLLFLLTTRHTLNAQKTDTVAANAQRGSATTLAGIEFVFIPGGTFDMGDTFGEGERNEKPAHRVTLDHFYLSKTEVTFAQYDAFCEETGRQKPDDKGWGRGNRPVINVTWHDAAAYCIWLSKKTGTEVRLPTEAEWEYAAREGGKHIRFGNGRNKADPREINFNGSSQYKKSYSVAGIYRQKTMPVASFPLNALGLYDMSGNVYEWCSDWFSYDYYSRSPSLNPKGPSSGRYRVLRGGCWYSIPIYCRCSFRDRGNPSGGYYLEGNGFRLAITHLKSNTVSVDVGDRLEAGSGKTIVGDFLSEAGIEFVFIPGGTFDMGDTFGEGERNEKPAHRVTLDHFYLSKTEVTFAQYDAFCEETGRGKPDDNGWGRGNRPVIWVSWYDAAAYCDWLSKKTGTEIRLPTEAEWEYAAREGGKHIRFGNGRNKADPREINFDGSILYKTGYSVSGIDRFKTMPVASFPPNALGLYDMSGNVYEWCVDWYDKYYYQERLSLNPEGPSSGQYRVMRGGGWESKPSSCRCSSRVWNSPGDEFRSAGFRVVRAP